MLSSVTDGFLYLVIAMPLFDSSPYCTFHVMDTPVSRIEVDLYTTLKFDTLQVLHVCIACDCSVVSLSTFPSQREANNCEIKISIAPAGSHFLWKKCHTTHTINRIHRVAICTNVSITPITYVCSIV